MSTPPASTLNTRLMHSTSDSFSPSSSASISVEMRSSAGLFRRARTSDAGAGGLELGAVVLEEAVEVPHDLVRGCFEPVANYDPRAVRP